MRARTTAAEGQLALFSRPSAPPTAQPYGLARRRDPPTSHAAAVAAKRFANEHCNRIFDALAAPGTIYEIGARCGLTHVQVARRLPEMDNVEPTDERRDGCRVWRRK